MISPPTPPSTPDPAGRARYLFWVGVAMLAVFALLGPLVAADPGGGENAVLVWGGALIGAALAAWNGWRWWRLRRM